MFATLQLPDGASFYRTDAVVKKAVALMQKEGGVKHTVGITGYNAATQSKGSNGGAVFITLSDHKERVKQEQIIGVVTEFYRGEKKISMKGTGYKLYVRFWHFSYPIRRIVKYVRGRLCRK